MSSNSPHFGHGRTGSAITVMVIPRAKKNEIVEILGDGTVKIRLAAPAAYAKGNEVLIRFLAEILEISPARIEIVAGESGPDKLITIFDLDSATAQARVLSHTPGSPR